MRRNNLLLSVLLAHGCVLFLLSVLQLVTKWFPYGSSTVRLREWLYRFL